MIREQFLKTIQKFRMIEKGETIFVAVSSGADSVTLLHLLNGLKESWKLNLGILHVNHGLRGKASDQDEVFVRKLASHFKVPFFSASVNMKTKMQAQKISLEEAAREARYHFFEKTAVTQGAHKIALAHTQDDQAETVLMRMITGTGLQGLQAVRPKRKLGGLFLVRPLIEISRDEIRRFVRARKIRFREDRSNRSTQFLRNRIRLKLIPFIERSFNPQVKKALARLPYLLDVDLSFLEETADILYKKLANKKRSNEVSFTRKFFSRLQPSIQYRLVVRALRELEGTGLDFDHWNRFLEMISTKDRFRLQFPKGILASSDRGNIRLIKKTKKTNSFSCALSSGQSIYIPQISSTISCEVLAKRVRRIRKSDKKFEILDADKLSFPLLIRNRRPGDRFQPLGQKFPLKLKGFLINKRIPLEDRARIPIVFSRGKAVWVGGVALGESFKISPETRHFVRIQLSNGR